MLFDDPVNEEMHLHHLQEVVHALFVD